MIRGFKNIGWPTLLDALCLAAPVGMFYDSLGRLLIWSLFGVSLISFRRLQIDWRLGLATALYLISLALISLYSLNPAPSLAAVARMCLGFLIFLPGVYVGIRWRRMPPGLISFLPVLILAAAHLLSPQPFEGRVFFGFEENPNIVGRGLTVAVLGLFNAGCSLWDLSAVDPRFHGRALRAVRWFAYGLSVVAIIALLVVSNFRSGWLGLCAAALWFLFSSRSLTYRKKLAISLVLGLLLALLIFFKDYKGFGYGSVGERLDLWTRAVLSWHDGFFLFGSGFSSFNQMSHLYFYGNVSRAFNYPHNIVVEILFSVGFLGLIATLAFVAYQIRIFWGSRLDFASPLARSAFASVLTLLIIGQFDMEFSSFDYIASVSFFSGMLYAQRANPALSFADN